jgi:hypothetical protein
MNRKSFRAIRKDTNVTQGKVGERGERCGQTMRGVIASKMILMI